MSQRDGLAKVLQSSADPLTIKQIVDRLTEGFPKEPGNYTTALGKLCNDGYVIKNDKNKPYLYSWANKEYVFTQETRKKGNTELEETEKKGSVLEVYILRALMSDIDHPMTKQEIGSIVRKKPSSLDKPLKRLEGKGFVSELIINGQYYYQVVNGSIKIVYKLNSAGKTTIDVIATLRNYKDNLSSMYMSKSRIDFDLNHLKQVSGLDLTKNGTVTKATFREHVELKEKLNKYINIFNFLNIYT